jgi:hypothetical protein
LTVFSTCPADHRSSLPHRAVPTISDAPLWGLFRPRSPTLPVLPLPFDASCRTAQEISCPPRRRNHDHHYDPPQVAQPRTTDDSSLNNVLLILAHARTQPRSPGSGNGRPKAAKSAKAKPTSKSSATARRKPRPTTTTPPTKRSGSCATSPCSFFDVSQADPMTGATVPENPVQQLTGDTDKRHPRPSHPHLAGSG